MADWKDTIKKVAADLGFGGSDKTKKKHGIDISRWFPEKTAPVKAQGLKGGDGRPVPQAGLIAPPTRAEAPPPPTRTLSVGAISPAKAATPEPPLQGPIAPSRASSVEGRSPRKGVAQTRPQQPTMPTKPPGNIGSTEGVFDFPDISQLTVRFPDCNARLDWMSEPPPLAEQSATLREWVCVLGLDFGTAFTKACIGVRGKHYFVHWDECISYPQSYLLPTFITEMENGRCVLGSVSGGTGVEHSGLKMALLASPTEAQRVRAVVFFALAMQYARTWMWRKHRDVIAGFKLTWLINIGLPTSYWDDQQPASDLFRRIALAGWRLSFSTTPIDIEAATAELNAVEDQVRESQAAVSFELEKIEAFPEFGAQIHSYSTASQSRKDLHLLVDIGAGTVDIVTFHIGQDDNEELNAIMDSSVEAAGTHVLLLVRSKAAGIRQSSWDDADTRLTSDQFENTHQLPRGMIKPRESEFIELLGRRIREVLSTTKKRRYALAPNWDDLPYFLVGGGRDVDVYRSAPSEGARNLLLRLHQMRFPLPDRDSLELAGLPESDFHRVSVAHGLSFDPFNIRKTCRKKESEDLVQRTTSRPSFSERFVDKSQV